MNSVVNQKCSKNQKMSHKVNLSSDLQTKKSNNIHYLISTPKKRPNQEKSPAQHLLTKSSQFSLVLLQNKSNFLPKLNSQRLSYKLMKRVNQKQSCHKYYQSSFSIENSNKMNEQILKRIQKKLYPLNKQIIRKIRLKRQYQISKQSLNSSILKQFHTSNQQNQTVSKEKQNYATKKMEKIRNKRNKYNKKPVKYKQERTKTQEKALQLQQKVQNYLISKRNELQKIKEQEKQNNHLNLHKEYSALMKQGNKIKKYQIETNRCIRMTTQTKLDNDKFYPQEIFNDTINPGSTIKKIKKKSTHYLKNNTKQGEQSQIKKVLKLFKQRQKNKTSFQNAQKGFQQRLKKTKNNFYIDNIQNTQKNQTKYTKNAIQTNPKQLNTNFIFQQQQKQTKMAMRRQGIKDDNGQMKSTFNILTENDSSFNQNDQTFNYQTIKKLTTKKKLQLLKAATTKRSQQIKQIPTVYNISAQQNNQLNEQLMDQMIFELFNEKSNAMKKKLNHGKMIRNNRNSALLGV